MTDQAFIYLIVALNALLQAMLIGRLKFAAGGRWKYQACAIALPLAVLATMRLAVAFGLLPARVADQSAVERWLTTAAGIALLAGPVLVTVAAIARRTRKT